MQNAWSNGARWNIFHEGVREFEVGRVAHEAMRAEADHGRAFEAVVARGNTALEQAGIEGHGGIGHPTARAVPRLTVVPLRGGGREP